VIRFGPAPAKVVKARAILAVTEAALGVKAVTVNRPVTVNRGRPNSGNALTPAEKQAAYRARRAAAKAPPKAA
jgi:hypothetical protein